MADIPILLLHGLGSSSAREWIDTGWADLLSSGGRAVLLQDLPAHGSAAKSHDVADYSDAVARIIDFIRGNGGQADSIGFSAGGQLILRAAAAAPECFRRIAVLGVGDRIFADPDGRRPGFRDANTMHGMSVIDQLKDAPYNDRAAIDAFIKGGLRPVDVRCLSRITASVLLVIGDRDFTGGVERAAAGIRRSSSLVVAGVDHFRLVTDRRVISAVYQFIMAP